MNEEIPENDFLSDGVREMFEAAEAKRKQEISKIMSERGLDYDSAELEFYRAQMRTEKSLLQNAMTHDEFMEGDEEEGDFEFDGYLIDEEDLNQRFYVHMKTVNADGIDVTIWAEENEWEGHECTSPETVKGYRVTIPLYDRAESEGVVFLIQLDDVWTREKIFEEFASIVDKVKERVDLGYFEIVYGKLEGVIWGGPYSVDEDGKLHPDEGSDE